MSFYVADAVNGRNLIEGQPVVGFIVNYQNQGYPLRDNPNDGGVMPSHFFALESLPIFGKVGDCGCLKVADESQLAVRLACQMTGTQNWKDLADKAFNDKYGVQFMGRADTDEPAPQNRRVYGLCLMHRDTYEYLVGQGRSPLEESYARDGYEGEQFYPENKTEDVAAVKRVLDLCIQSPQNIWKRPRGMDKPEMSEFLTATHLARIASLTADHYILEEVLKDEQKLPRLIRGLGTADGKIFGADFQELMRRSGLVGHELLAKGYSSVDEVPDLTELLEQTWTCIHLTNRMYDIHAHFVPAFYAGQDHNSPSVMALNRATLQAVWNEFVDERIEHYDEEHPEVLEEELNRMQEMVDAMREKVRKARSGG